MQATQATSYSISWHSSAGRVRRPGSGAHCLWDGWQGSRSPVLPWRSARQGVLGGQGSTCAQPQGWHMSRCVLPPFKTSSWAQPVATHQLQELFT